MRQVGKIVSASSAGLCARVREPVDSRGRARLGAVDDHRPGPAQPRDLSFVAAGHASAYG